ncbi:MAG: pilus assembly protein TadG-related protein [Octadecabacter sp.]
MRELIVQAGKILDRQNAPFAEFREDDEGAVTILGLFFFMASLMIVGLALDGANGWRARAQLQVATDASALAAAANLDNIEYARSLALDVANRNLSDSAALVSDDIVFGNLDPDTLQFTASADSDGEYSAVTVLAGHNTGRGNPVPTFLMTTIGINSLDVNASSMAVSTVSADAVDEEVTCHDAMFLSEGFVQTGGGNDFLGAVCIHGASGLNTGGNDYLNEDVRFTAETLTSITLNSYQPETLDSDQLIAARTLQPVLLDQLDDMRDDIWDDLWISRATDPDLWEQPDAPWGGKQWYYVGEYEISADDYDGILPEFIFDDSGIARVEMHDQYWSIQPGDLSPNTIYLSEQSMQFAGGVDIEDAAFISQGDIGVGGGDTLSFDDAFFIGSQVNMAGNINWGAETDACEGEYGIYVFGTTSLSLGGWSSGTTVAGMVGAAPSFSPGGAMTGTGLYFESRNDISMGGAYTIYGCDTQRESDLPIADTAMSTPGAQSTYGSVLYR